MWTYFSQVQYLEIGRHCPQSRNIKSIPNEKKELEVTKNPCAIILLIDTLTLLKNRLF